MYIYIILVSFIACGKPESNVTSEAENNIESNENASTEQAVSSEETASTEETLDNIEEEKIVVEVPEKYLNQLGLDSRFNDWANTERNIDDFISIYGMPIDGDDAVYNFNNYYVYFDRETRIVQAIGLNPTVFNTLNAGTPGTYNPYDLPVNLKTLKPVIETGYFEILKMDLKSPLTGSSLGEQEVIKRPTLDLKVESSKEAFLSKYKNIFDLENDIGEAYISNNYVNPADRNFCIDFRNNIYYVIWHCAFIDDSGYRKDALPQMTATVSMIDNSIIELSEPHTQARDENPLTVRYADEFGIEY